MAPPVCKCVHTHVGMCFGGPERKAQVQTETQQTHASLPSWKLLQEMQIVEPSVAPSWLPSSITLPVQWSHEQALLQRGISRTRT